MRSKAPGEQREDGNSEDITPALATRFGAVTVLLKHGFAESSCSRAVLLVRAVNLREAGLTLREAGIVKRKWLGFGPLCSSYFVVPNLTPT